MILFGHLNTVCVNLFKRAMMHVWKKYQYEIGEAYKYKNKKLPNLNLHISSIKNYK